MTRELRHIALIRHARSSHVHAGWVNADGFRRWREAYEAAGIRDDQAVPAELQRLVARSDIVLCSDAARAVATADLIAPGREVVVSQLLRELELEGPGLGGARMPLGAWPLAVGARILARKLRGLYPSADELARLDDAVALLDELSTTHPRMVVITHGMFRRRLSARLIRMGWRADGTNRSMRPLSAWQLSRLCRP